MINIKENGFEPGSNMGGPLGGSQWGTFSSPDVSQNSNQFASSNNNKALGSHSNTAKDVPTTGSINKDLNAIYSKKNTPSPDEIVMGIKFEMGQQIKKDKYVAKQAVLANLKKNPRHYSSMAMLNVTDQDMLNNMNESKSHPNDAPLTRTKITPNIAETKKIFSELMDKRDNRYVVNSKICDAMKESWKDKKERNSWRTV
jgi:hypothetical protein